MNNAQLEQGRVLQRNSLKFKVIFAMVAVIGIIFSTYMVDWVIAQTPATGTPVIYDLDYEKEILTIKAGAGTSNKFYFSADNRRTWTFIDVASATPAENKIDISAFLKTKESVIYIRGNKDTYPVAVTLMAEPAALKPKYAVEEGKGKMVWEGPINIEYKKGTNGDWVTWNTTPYMATENYELTGTTLYIRTAATKAVRASRVATFKVPKKPTAPSAKYDGSKFLISGLNAKTMEYRINNATAWSPLAEGTKTMEVTSLFGLTNNVMNGGVFEVRLKATAKKPASLVRVIEVPTQPIMIASEVKIEGSTITIAGANKNNVYEYTRIDSDKTFNLATAKWTAISSNKPVIVPRTSITDTFYIRRKAVTDKVTKVVTPASTFISHKVVTVTIK